MNSQKVPPAPYRWPAVPNNEAAPRPAAAKPPSGEICDACYAQLTTRSKTQPHADLLFRGEIPALAVLKDRGATGTFRNFFCSTCKTMLLQHFDDLGTPGSFRLSP